MTPCFLASVRSLALSPFHYYVLHYNLPMYIQVYISSLALLKMLKHGRAGVPMEVMGLMLGEFVDEYTGLLRIHSFTRTLLMSVVLQ